MKKDIALITNTNSELIQNIVINLAERGWNIALISSRQEETESLMKLVLSKSNVTVVMYREDLDSTHSLLNIWNYFYEHGFVPKVLVREIVDTTYKNVDNDFQRLLASKKYNSAYQLDICHIISLRVLLFLATKKSNADCSKTIFVPGGIMNNLPDRLAERAVQALFSKKKVEIGQYAPYILATMKYYLGKYGIN